MKDYIIKQNDISDCGACCLASIIKYYNGFVPLEVIKTDTLTNSSGTSFYNLKEAAIKYGFEVQGYYNEPNIKCPYIAQLRINNGLYHFVVVYKVLKNSILCMDPAVGIKKYNKDEFSKIFTGNLLKLNPINKIVTYNKNNHFISFIKQSLKKNSYFLCMVFILSIIIIILSLFNIYSIKLILENNIKLIKPFVIFIIIKNLLNYTKNYLLAHLNKNNSIDLIKDYLNHIFFLPFKYLQLKSSGDIISRINDLNIIKDFITKEVINIIISFLFLISSLVIMFYLNKYLTIILFIISIIFFAISYIINKKNYNYYMDYLDSESKMLDNIIEYLGGIKTIKNLGKEEFFLNKSYRSIDFKYHKSYILDKYLNKLELLSSIYTDLNYLLIIIFSINLNIGNVLVYILYFNYFNNNIDYYIKLIPNITYIRSILTRVNSIYYIDKEKANNGLKITNNNLKISNLDYKVNLNHIFKEYSLIINKNDKVLIKGNNGVGKSTLLYILNNNINDYNGDILIGGKSIKDYSQRSIKNNIIYTGEIDTLFSDTIINNIILDKPYNKKIINRLENILELKTVIIKKENGFNTIVHDNLSRGERQKIILARALYQNPRILLLDESLSEINSQARIRIINNINKYYKDKTIIYVSHNLEKYPFNKIIELTARKE